MARTRPGMVSLAMALLALAMLSLASVRSAVMQAAMASLGEAQPDRGEGGRPVPAAMPGMAMAGTATAAPSGKRPSGRGHPHQAVCPYCTVAHLPVVGHAPIPRRIAVVSFVAFHLVASRGPRGPPAFERRARGPPPVFPEA